MQPAVPTAVPTKGDVPEATSGTVVELRAPAQSSVRVALAVVLLSLLSFGALFCNCDHRLGVLPFVWRAAPHAFRKACRLFVVLLLSRSSSFAIACFVSPRDVLVLKLRLRPLALNLLI